MRLLHFPVQFQFRLAKLIRSHPGAFSMVVSYDAALLGGNEKSSKATRTSLEPLPKVPSPPRRFRASRLASPSTVGPEVFVCEPG